MAEVEREGTAAVLARVLDGAEAVVFDVGETLVDESRAWAEAAAAVGATPFTVMGVLGALIERGEDHRRVWPLLGVAAPPPGRILPGDLYPDAVPCLAAVRAAGLRVGVAGNQPAGAVEGLAAAGIPADFTGSSAEWGVRKPDPAFFLRAAEAAGAAPDRVVAIGDRLDNDVLPARAAGLRTVLLRRGPWGHVHAMRSEAALADARIGSLAELTDALGAQRSRMR